MREYFTYFFIVLAFILVHTGCQKQRGGIDEQLARGISNVLLEENFNSDTITPALQLEIGWPTHYAPYAPFQVFSEIPGSVAGDRALHYVVLQGTNERAPLTASVSFSPDQQEIYIEHDSYFQPGFPWAESSQKFLRCGYSGGGRLMFELIIPWENTAVNMDFFDLAHNKQYTTSTNEPHPEGQKVKWGLWVKLNTPGQSNGFMRLLKSGIEVAAVMNAPLRGTTVEGFDFCWIGGNSSMYPGNVLVSDGHRFADNIRICSTYPCVGAVDPVPTPQPTAWPTAAPTARPTATPRPTPTPRPAATPRCTCTCKVVP